VDLAWQDGEIDLIVGQNSGKALGDPYQLDGGDNPVLPVLYIVSWRALRH
jgi:hypothetical protein